jgi:arginase
MGAGPDALAPVIAETLRAADHETCVELVESTRTFGTEITVSFELMRAIALRVADASRVGELPIVSSGNCGIAVGTLAGLGPARTGVLWLDAHGELNTPDTTRSGFLDGMGLAVATGRAWPALAREIPGFVPLPDEQLVMAGMRDLDVAERELMERSTIRVIPADTLRRAGSAALRSALDTLRARVSLLYLHIDVDVFDERVAPSNEYGDDQGLSREEVTEILELARQRFTIGAVGIGSYDPAVDADERTPPLIAELVASLVP